MRDACIIGAGPAGSAAAIVLCRLGWRVHLFEQHRFPRDKVCGECLSALGMAVLERLGLSQRARIAGAVELTRATLYAPSGTALSVALPKPIWGLSRHRLDELLLRAACESGAILHQPVRVESVEPGPSPWLRARDLSNNTLSQWSASCLLLADGKAGLLDDRPTPTGDLGIKGHFQLVAGPADAIELFGVRGHYVGLAAIEDGRWDLACSVPVERVQRCRGDLDRLFEQLRSENRELARRMSDSRQMGPWLTSPLPRFGVAGVWPPGVIPLGNAAAALEPIGGEGMGLALASAELAALALEQAEVSGRPMDAGALRNAFHRLWDRRRFACRLVALAMSRPAWAQLGLRGGTLCRPAISQLLAWMGKSPATDRGLPTAAASRHFAGA